MILLPHSSTDGQLLEIVHKWVQLLEAEKYEEACLLIGCTDNSGWSAELIKQCIKSYGEAIPTQKVTFEGKSTDISQVVDVSRWNTNPYGSIGEVWYDLNIDGFVSDLTATFRILYLFDGLVLQLKDIHVM